MKLAHIRQLIFGEQAPITGTSAVTTSASIARFPQPIGGIVRRKKKITVEATQVDTALPSFGYNDIDAYWNAVVSEYVLRAGKRLGNYGIEIQRKDGHLLIKAPTGRSYDLKIKNNWAVLVRANERIEFPYQDDYAPRVKGLPFLAWRLPPDDEVVNIATSESLVHKMVFESVPWLIKTEAMTEFPAFVDLSVGNTVSQATLKRLAKHFKPILDPVTYEGGFNNFEQYRKTYGPKPYSDISSLPAFQSSPLGSMSEATHPEHFVMTYQPWFDADNRYDRQFAWFNWDEQFAKLANLECNGKKGKIESQYIYWGDNVRFVSSFNIIDWLEVQCPDKNGETDWCSVYSFPKTPKGNFDGFLSEMKGALTNLHIPPRFEPYPIDMVDLLWRAWHAIIPEWYFCGGLAYHKDDTWGLFFYPCAYGLGIPMNEQPISKAMHYFWRVQPNGFLKFCVDQNQTRSQTSIQPSARDISFIFYPRQGEKLIAEMIRRYTYSA